MAPGVMRALQMLCLQLTISASGPLVVGESGCAVLGNFYPSPGSLIPLKTHCLQLTCIGLHSDLQPLPACTCTVAQYNRTRNLSLHQVKQLRQKGQLLYDEKDLRTQETSSLTYAITSGQRVFLRPQEPQGIDARKESSYSGVPAVAAEVDLSLNPKEDQQITKRSISRQNQSHFSELKWPTVKPPTNPKNDSSSTKQKDGEEDFISLPGVIRKRPPRRYHRRAELREAEYQFLYSEPLGKALCSEEWSNERMNLVGALSLHCLAVMCDRYMGLLLLTPLSHCNCTHIVQDGATDTSKGFYAAVHSEGPHSNRSVRFLQAATNKSYVSSGSPEESPRTTSISFTTEQDETSTSQQSTTSTIISSANLLLRDGPFPLKTTLSASIFNSTLVQNGITTLPSHSQSFQRNNFTHMEGTNMRDNGTLDLEEAEPATNQISDRADLPFRNVMQSSQNPSSLPVQSTSSDYFFRDPIFFRGMPAPLTAHTSLPFYQSKSYLVSSTTPINNVSNLSNIYRSYEIPRLGDQKNLSVSTTMRENFEKNWIWDSILNHANHETYFGAPSYEEKLLRQKPLRQLKASLF